jgi:hypothetical protein
MAYQDHLLRYRLKTSDQLVTEMARLEALNSGFASLGMGTKQFALALSQNIDQMNAVAFVQRERGYTVPDGLRDTKNTMSFTTDFSQI